MTSPVEKMRGARIRPARCISDETKISDARDEGLWLVVVPIARLTISDQFCCGTSSSSPCDTCACASTKPGTIDLPAASIVTAPAGTVTALAGPRHGRAAGG